MKSGQDPPDPIVLESQDSKGPSTLPPQRIKEVFWRIVVGRHLHARQELTPSVRQVGHGKLMDYFEVHLWLTAALRNRESMFHLDELENQFGSATLARAYVILNQLREERSAIEP
ncbi:MAG: hypothetical protein WB510_04945 [Candidatus Sulfotelmatobacter sp.]